MDEHVSADLDRRADDIGEGDKFRSGFVALIGRPNTGKSTFLNSVVGSKVSIVSEKPQTTRNRVRGILSRPDWQAVFIDTPGIHRPKHGLGAYMVSQARAAIKDVDLVLFFVDINAGIGGGDSFIADELSKVDLPVLLCLNKVDIEGEDGSANTDISTLPIQPAGLFRISALTGEGVEPLLEAIPGFLPEGPKYYPDEEVTDNPEEFVISEIIREKLLEATEEEVPHSLAVVVERIRERAEKELLDIDATIYVEKDSQKGIVIGKGGRMLKGVGSLAREELESLFGIKVNLQLWVKQSKDWRRDKDKLRRYGYHESR